GPTPFPYTTLFRSKAEGEPAARRPEAGTQQRVDGDRAAQLVAVDDGVDQCLGAGTAAVEPVHVVDAGIPATPCRDVRRLQFDARIALRHRRLRLRDVASCDAPTIG